MIDTLSIACPDNNTVHVPAYSKRAVIEYDSWFSGTFPQLVVTILLAIESTRDAAKIVDWVFIALLPNYNMGIGVANLFTNYQYQDLCYVQLPDSIPGFNGTSGRDAVKKYCEATTSPFPCCVGKWYFTLN